MKQKIAIMLLLSTALGALASCGGADDSSKPAADETTASGEPQEITLSADSDYVIVCDEQGLESERKAAEQLAAYLEKITGRKYSIVDDDTAPADHEIIVGKTYISSTAASSKQTSFAYLPRATELLRSARARAEHCMQYMSCSSR